MATFIDRFNILFEESGLSQEDFGKPVGASKSQVFNWRSGRGEPDTEQMKNIAKVHNVSVSWLLGETETRNPLVSDETYQRAADKYISDLIAYYERADASQEERKTADRLKSMSRSEQRAIAMRHVKSAKIIGSNVEYDLYSIEETIEEYKSLPAENQKAIANIIRLFAASQR